MKKLVIASLAICAGMLVVQSASAQAPAAPAPAAAPAYAPGYGPNITLEKAKKVAAAAAEEAKKNNWNMVITIVEPNGSLVYLEKNDNTQYASVDIAIGKAKTSATLRRATRVLFEAMQTPAGAYYITFPGLVGGSGGVPIAEGGKIIGAIGISGGTGAQDHQVGEAGAAALK